jgi:hypothetical protein
VSAIFVVVSNVLASDPPHVQLVERDHMIETVAAGTADPSFRRSVLRGTPDTGPRTRGAVPEHALRGRAGTLRSGAGPQKRRRETGASLRLEIESVDNSVAAESTQVQRSSTTLHKAAPSD